MLKTERLYLTNWEYNMARVLSRLAVVVENNGGEIIYHNYDSIYMLSNRSVMEKVRENNERIKGLKGSIEVCPNMDKRAELIKRLEAENEEYKTKYAAESENPIKCTHMNYIKFTLDGYYYYYQVEHNFLFEFYIHKYPIDNGEYDANRYPIEDKKEWMYDCLFKWGCSNEEIKEIANILFNTLVSSKCGNLVSSKKRVPNYYDNRYHYEYFHEKNMRKI